MCDRREKSGQDHANERHIQQPNWPIPVRTHFKGVQCTRHVTKTSHPPVSFCVHYRSNPHCNPLVLEDVKAATVPHNDGHRHQKPVM